MSILVTHEQVNIWACEQRLSLGQLATEEKSNEITAIPELIEILDIKGALVTINAMGCQRDIAQKITESGGGYLLSLKRNQGTMYKAVDDSFRLAEIHHFKGIRVAHHDNVDAGHGRVEARHHTLSRDCQSLPDINAWSVCLRRNGVKRAQIWCIERAQAYLPHRGTAMAERRLLSMRLAVQSSRAA